MQMKYGHKIPDNYINNMQMKNKRVDQTRLELPTYPNQENQIKRSSDVEDEY